MLLGALAFVALCYNIADAATSQAWDKSITLEKNSKEYLVPGTPFFHDYNGFPYGICRSVYEGEKKTEQVCNVTLVNSSFSKKDLQCPYVRLVANKNREFFLDGYFQLTPYADNKIIIGWWEQSKEKEAAERKSNFKISILNMADCSMSNLDFPIDRVAYGFFPSILLYSNELDVIVNSKEKCKTSDVCRVAYDLKGKQIGGVQPYLSKLSGYASPVSESDPSKGFFMLVQDLKTSTILLVDSKGNAKKVNVEEFENGIEKQRIAFSNSNGKFSTCRLPENPTKSPTTIYCNQFDSQGSVVFKTEVIVSKAVSWLAVRNSPKGGLILATSACDGDQRCQDFAVYKINKEGKQSQPKRVNNFDLKCYESPQSKPDHTELGVHVHERKDLYCFDFSCLDGKNLKFKSRCESRESIENLPLRQ